MDDDNIQSMTRKKNIILKRIEENKRLMELIKNPHIKDSLKPAQQMKKISAIKKIQREWRNYKQKLIQLNLHQNSVFNLQNMRINKKSKNSSMNFINAVILIQKSCKKFLHKKYKEKLRNFYVQNYSKEFFSPLKFDRVQEIKLEILNRFKSMYLPDKFTDFQDVLNEYYNKYRNFNETFPERIKVREDNISMYYQSQEIMQHMSNQSDLENLKKFELIHADEKKKEKAKKDLDKILGSIQHKMWWYKYNDVEDFEEENLINDIDIFYNFPKRSQILSKK